MSRILGLQALQLVGMSSAAENVMADSTVSSAAVFDSTNSCCCCDCTQTCPTQ